MIPSRTRDALAIALAVAVLLAAAVVWIAQRPDLGLTMTGSVGHCSVATVTPGGHAESLGIDPGNIVLDIDGHPACSGLGLWESLLRVQRSDGGVVVLDVGQARAAFNESLLAWIAGVLLLVAAGWWLRGEWTGTPLLGMATPLACAAAIPLLGAPLRASGTPAALLAGVAASAIGVSLLADGIATLRRERAHRAMAMGSAVAAAVIAVTLGLLPLGGVDPSAGAAAASWVAFLLVALLPMILASRDARIEDRRLAGPDGPGAAWLLGAVATPALVVLGLAVAPDATTAAVVVALWLGLLVASRTVTRRIARARLQRDLVVSATEAERARLAADLHDVALQELTMLVRRLDASGDTDAAAMARSVSDRLRELCGELHLPILDELGAGPALEWLVSQVAAATDEDLRLERADPARPPAGVELAFFRVAQEAISNAVKHGGSPIVIRYVTTPSAATLSVDDAGAPDGPHGSGTGAASIASRPGHYGLVTMQQRAEQIGALLAIQPWPGGGTRVTMEWKAP